MESRRWTVLVALFYPFAIATVTAGLLAFVLILLRFDMLLIATVVLWFYFMCAVSIYLISKDALRTIGVNRIFLGFTITIGVLAVLSALMLGLGLSAGVRVTS